jgi:DNA-binding transcriptional LysR family regulator
VLADYGRRVAGLEEQAISAVRELRGGSRGALRVGASTTIAVYLLPEAVVGFRRIHSGVDIRLTVSNSAQVARQVGEGDLDVGFIEVSPDDDALTCRVFRQDHLVAVAAPSHPLSRKRRVGLKELCAQPFVVRDTGSETKSFVERELAARGLRVSPVMSVVSTEAVKRAVAAGIGVGIVSKLSIDLEVEARRLAVLRVDGLGIRRPLFRVVRKRMPGFAALEAFTAAVECQ